MGERGILVGAIREPTVPRGQARLRITLSTAHTDADLETLLEALAACLASIDRVPARAEKVLDLGCGPGEMTAQLAERFGSGCTVIGLDLAPGMLEVARRTHDDAARWLCGDATCHRRAAQAEGFCRIDCQERAMRFHYPDLAAVMASIKGVVAQTSRPGRCAASRHSASPRVCP